MKEQPNYYAIIPANVRYCKELAAQEKLLYGEITALANSRGYCFASNSYFADLYEVSERTVIRNIINLEKCGFIKRQIITDEVTKQVLQRRLYIVKETSDTEDDIFVTTPGDKNVTTPGDKNVTTPGDKNVTTPGDKNVTTPGDKNVTYNTTSISSTSFNNTSINNNMEDYINNVKDVVVVHCEQSSKFNKKKKEPSPAKDDSLDNELVTVQTILFENFNIRLTIKQAQNIFKKGNQSIEYIKEKIEVTKKSPCDNIIGFLIAALESNYSLPQCNEVFKQNVQPKKSKFCNYEGRKWDHEKLAELEQEYLRNSVNGTNIETLKKEKELYDIKNTTSHEKTMIERIQEENGNQLRRLLMKK